MANDDGSGGPKKDPHTAVTQYGLRPLRPETEPSVPEAIPHPMEPMVSGSVMTSAPRVPAALPPFPPEQTREQRRQEAEMQMLRAADAQNSKILSVVMEMVTRLEHRLVESEARMHDRFDDIVKGVLQELAEIKQVVAENHTKLFSCPALRDTEETKS